MTAREALGRNVRSARALRRWDQPELAQAMTNLGYDWSPSTVSRVEKGERGTPVEEILALALVLGTRLPDLLVPSTAENLELGNYALRPGFVHNWAKGDLIMFQRFDDKGNALPSSVVAVGSPELDSDTQATAIERRNQ